MQVALVGNREALSWSKFQTQPRNLSSFKQIFYELHHNVFYFTGFIFSLIWSSLVLTLLKCLLSEIHYSEHIQFRNSPHRQRSQTLNILLVFKTGNSKIHTDVTCNTAQKEKTAKVSSHVPGSYLSSLQC